MKLRIATVVSVFFLCMLLAGCAANKCDCPPVGEVPATHLDQATASLCD